MSLRGGQLPEVMSAAASLHRYDTSGRLGREADDRLTLCATTQNHCTGRIKADETATVLAEVDSQHRD
ncbi:hypothetical protein GCM10007884_45560 [Methylobacterium brachythecii]|uniref:Uncharacterized protein n=1 Tax=Methylobacterium brachythecii TaxID=1176177 RepID=A0ABQ6DEG5_9HYPH|nr:hypothetical protein GCM10007884_45560 [Methylobacterium brachythecii]